MVYPISPAGYEIDQDCSSSSIQNAYFQCRQRCGVKIESKILPTSFVNFLTFSAWVVFADFGKSLIYNICEDIEAMANHRIMEEGRSLTAYESEGDIMEAECV